MRKRTDGFTLVELMVVVLVIGILVAVAVPVFNAAKTRAEANTCQANQRTWAGIVQQAKASNAEPNPGGEAVNQLGSGSAWDSVAASSLKSGLVCPTSKQSYWVQETPAGRSSNGALYGCTGDSALPAWASGHVYAAAGSSEFIQWQGLTYKVITAEDGRQWLDRNLGATSADPSDAASYGYYYQWGRGNDGHESPTSSPVAGATDTPGSDFIRGASPLYDWRANPDTTLWAPGSATDPCPPGFHVPTASEWATWVTAAKVNNSTTAARSVLRLPAAGFRDPDGALAQRGVWGDYWSSTSWGSNSFDLNFSGGTLTANASFWRSYGFSVRAIRDR